MPHTLADQQSDSLAAYVVGIHEQPKEFVNDDGVKTASITFLVEIRSKLIPNEGPWGDGGPAGGADIFGLETPTAGLAACAVGMPKTGEGYTSAFVTGSLPFAYFTEGTRFLRCQPGYKAVPYKAGKGERARFWLVKRDYASGSDDLYLKNPQETNRSNGDYSLNMRSESNVNVTTSGSFSKISRPFRNSYASCPIKDFHGNANDSSELMRQVSYMTVTIDKIFEYIEFDGTKAGVNRMQLPGGSDIVLAGLTPNFYGFRSTSAGEMAGILSYALNKVNVFPMWGYPPRHVRFEDVTWNKFYSSAGREYLKAKLTFKIAPPWLTSISANNPESRYRSSYGFDEPQIMLSNRFLNKELFKRPSNSRIPGESQNTPSRTPTNSGTYDESSQQLVKASLNYRRPTPGLFKIPPARTFELLGPDLLRNPGTYTSIGADEYAAGGVVSFGNVFVPSVGWQAWGQINDEANLANYITKNRPALSSLGPSPSPIERLNLWSWLVWNPMNYYDSTNMVFDYSLSEALSGSTDIRIIDPSERSQFCQTIQFDGDSDTVSGWSSTDLAPNAYSSRGDDRQTWVDFVPGVSDEATKTLQEKGHPIWVNTIATSYNFDKWPGFPYIPGQDMSEMLVYPAVDSGFDFNVFDLPTP